MLTASWDAVDGATHYHVTYSSDNGASWSLAALEHSTNSIEIGGVDNAETYIVGVRAKNGDDGGTWRNSDPAGPYTPPQPPAAVGSVSVTRADGSLTASWDAVDSATKYHVTYTDDSGGSYAPVDGHDNWPSTSMTFGADNAQHYRVGVRAGNDGGWSAWKDSPTVGPYTPPTPEPTPTPTPTPAPAPSVTAERGEDGVSASVTWTAYAGEDFSYYRVIVCTDEQYDGASCSGTVYKSAPVYDAASTGPVSVSGLDAQTGYGVILQTWRSGGALKSQAAIPALPAPPAAPSGLTVTPNGGNLTVSWDAVSGATGYDVRSSADGSSWTTEHSNVSGTSVSVANANGEIKQIGVRARNAGGASAWTTKERMPASDWLTTVQQDGPSARSVQAQNKLAAPAWGTLTRDNRPHRLHLNWMAVQGATGYNVACSDSDGWSWWQCGSTASGTTTLTVDRYPNGERLAKYRSYKVSVRAVTGNSSEASDWTVSANIRPVQGWLGNLASTRTGGSITLSWTPNPWTTGYNVYCDDYTSGQAAAYTLCATLTGQDDTASQHSVTISSWTASGTDYSIDDAKTYDVKIVSTNQWGQAQMIAPLIGPIPNVSNLGEASDTYGQSISSGRSAAVGFTTGSNSGGYTLQGVTVGFLAATGGRLPSNPLSVAIHAVSSGDPASSATYTLNRVHGDPKTTGNATYSCSGTCSLSANTTYFLVLATSDSNSYRWDTTASGNQTNSTNFGWSIADGLKSQSSNVWSATTWSARFRVSATPDPSLDASNVTATGATLTIANHGGGDWYYKHTNTGATCDGPVSGATKTLTLTAGTSYTYSAYSDSSCTSGNLLATASSFGTPGSVSNLSEASDGLGVSINSASSFATGFTTKANGSGYTLTSVTVKFRPPVGTPGTLTAAVHAASGGNPASSATHTLSGNDPSGAGEATFTCSGDCSLSADTTYFLVLTGTGSGSGNHYSWDTTASTGQTNTPGDFGWSIANAATRHFNNAWTPQSGWVGMFKVSAAPK